MNEKIQRMKELIEILTPAARAYYQESREIMSNFEYDRLYDELSALEAETGITLSGSLTQQVGHEVLSQLPKEAHQFPMLSLEKTKDVEALAAWLDDQKGVLSWKLDGLTIVLTYEDGRLLKAVTRGNGEIGEVVTSNARVFRNLPLAIPFKGRLVLRGEAVIRYSDFKKLNEEIEDVEARYKNPRNLSSGSVRQLNSEITAQRKVNFIAFALVLAAGEDMQNSRAAEFAWLQNQGFEVVEHRVVDAGNVAQAVADFASAVGQNDLPSDGLVLLMDDIAYGNALGTTAKFPRNAIAFKWADEIQVTHLREIEWSASRTGLINPVAVFDPVELEGTSVSRASVHNLSILEQLELGIGDEITVYKANMIIPQLADNLTRSNGLKVPESCPVCGGETKIKKISDAKSLYCTNPDCLAKKIKGLTLLASRDALNIEGLSEATLEKFVGAGFIRCYADLFHLSDYREKIVEMEGFGEKSYENLIRAIKKAADTTLPRFIYGLGIAGIGLSNAKNLCRSFGFDFALMRKAGMEELTAVDGIGEILAKAWRDYFDHEDNNRQVDALLAELTIAGPEQSQLPQPESAVAGKTFVITGSLSHFENRNKLKDYIEQLGGKTTGSVTSKTDYLINNDTASNSSKNKKARELDIPVISEEEFLQMSER